MFHRISRLNQSMDLAPGSTGRLLWLGLGGVFFWAPIITAIIATRGEVGILALNLLPFGGLALLRVLSVCVDILPRWGWALAGVYVFGPAAMFLPSLFSAGSSIAAVPGQALWLVFICAFPPATLWLALLNGTFGAVVIASIAIPLIEINSR